MVGNNMARDIVGATRSGLISVWFRWNDRYPGEPTTEWHFPDYTVHSASELLETLLALDDGDRDRELVARSAPVFMFDANEPFYPVKVGYSFIHERAVSPSFPRQIDLYVDEDRQGCGGSGSAAAQAVSPLLATGQTCLCPFA